MFRVATPELFVLAEPTLLPFKEKVIVCPETPVCPAPLASVAVRVTEPPYGPEASGTVKLVAVALTVSCLVELLLAPYGG